jgi:hypothetical protein
LRGSEREGSPGRHRVAGIGGEIDEDGFQLHAVGDDQGHSDQRFQPDADLSAQRVGQDFPHTRE